MVDYLTDMHSHILSIYSGHKVEMLQIESGKLLRVKQQFFICNDPHVQASLLSFLPADLLKISEIPRLTANAFTLLIRWFHDNFRVRSPSSAERPLHSSLAFALEAHEGTSEEVAALSVALFRALNLTTRFVSILDVAPLKLGTDKSESAIQNANRASKGIFDNSTLMVAEKEKIRFPSLLLNHPHAMARATSVNLLKTMHVQIRILNQQEKLLSPKILQSLIN